MSVAPTLGIRRPEPFASKKRTAVDPTKRPCKPLKENHGLSRGATGTTKTVRAANPTPYKSKVQSSTAGRRATMNRLAHFSSRYGSTAASVAAVIFPAEPFGQLAGDLAHHDEVNLDEVERIVI